MNRKPKAAPSAPPATLPAPGAPTLAPAAGAPPSEPPAPEGGSGGKAQKVAFLKPWSSDRGYFPAGAKAELPKEIATSLVAEGVAEATA